MFFNMRICETASPKKFTSHISIYFLKINVTIFLAFGKIINGGIEK